MRPLSWVLGATVSRFELRATLELYNSKFFDYPIDFRFKIFY